MRNTIKDIKLRYKKVVKDIKFTYNRVQNILALSKTPYYSRLLSLKKSDLPLKRSKSGMEIELMLLDKDGSISHESQKIMSSVKKLSPDTYISKETGKQMIELHSDPCVSIKDSAMSLISSAAKVISAAEKKDILIYPFACYPGRFEQKMHSLQRYKLQQNIFGERFSITSQVCGFHFHYTMPRGVFDYRKLFLKNLIRSKIKHSFLECYNMMIATDPALMTFMQSSPYVDNKYFAKDSRVILYRGGKKLNYMDGLYARHQILGGLPPYKNTLYDLQLSLLRKDRAWRELVKKNTLLPAKDKKLLDYSWNPVKVNKLGTLEQRGMDSNLISHIVASSVLIRVVLRAIQNDRLIVWPSDIGMAEPFKIEGNLVYIPPHSFVRDKLQRYAAYEGIKNKEVYSYCAKYFKFAKKLVNGKYHQLLRPIENIIEEKKTMSDIIIAKARKAGYGLNDTLPDEYVREFSLDAADEFKKDLFKTKEMLERV